MQNVIENIDWTLKKDILIYIKLPQSYWTQKVVAALQHTVLFNRCLNVEG